MQVLRRATRAGRQVAHQLEDPRGRLAVHVDDVDVLGRRTWAECSSDAAQPSVGMDEGVHRAHCGAAPKEVDHRCVHVVQVRVGDGLQVGGGGEVPLPGVAGQAAAEDGGKQVCRALRCGAHGAGGSQQLLHEDVDDRLRGREGRDRKRSRGGKREEW